MRLPVSHIVVYQGCATFITEGPNAIKQIRLWAAPSFHTGCPVLSDRHKNPLCLLHLPAGRRLHTPVVHYN